MSRQLRRPTSHHRLQADVWQRGNWQRGASDGLVACKPLGNLGMMGKYFNGRQEKQETNPINNFLKI